jgi:hypothetical protein
MRDNDAIDVLAGVLDCHSRIGDASASIIERVAAMAADDVYSCPHGHISANSAPEDGYVVSHRCQPTVADCDYGGTGNAFQIAPTASLGRASS